MLRFRLYYLLLLFPLLLIFGIGPYVDWLWFNNLGLGIVYWTMLSARILIRFAAWVFFFIFLLANLYFVRCFFPNPGNIVYTDQFGKPIGPTIVHGRHATIIAFLASVLLSYILTGYISEQWLTIQLFFRGNNFGFTDPIFQLDVGNYIFRLPFYLLLNGYLQMVITVTILIVSGLYIFLGTTRFEPRQLLSFFPGMKHVSILVVLFFLLKAWDYRLQSLQLLYSPRGVTFGASYTDIHALLPGLRILTFLAVVVAVAVAINIIWRRRVLFMSSIAVFVIASILLGKVYPSLVQQFRVNPNEANMERQFIEYNIEFTRKAYGLDQIQLQNYPGDQDLSMQDIQENRGTIDNIRLWDYRPLLQTYQQLQAMRLYYRFIEVDTDRYWIDGQYRQVMLAARELDQAELDVQAQNWVNQRLVFTHGYGLVMSPVNESTSEGLPKFVIYDIPPKTKSGLVIDRPEIYYGELTDPYVIVNTKTEEFDYPMGETNAYNHYQGVGGVQLNSFFRRVVFALYFMDYRLLFSDNITPESRIMFDRNIARRVRKAMPLLHYDPDPYLVLCDGRLFWLQDAYTISNMFPYSEPVSASTNYIRNSVKVVIDAYNGDLNFYISDPEDPIIQAYAKLFPRVFRPLEAMPTGLKQQIRYPEYLFTIQSKILTTYQMENPMVFYNREDQWQIPSERYAGNTQLVEPYYTIIQLPGEVQEEYVLMLPFTPRERNNMVAWFAARNDGEKYGQLGLYTFPKDRLLMGPAQIEARIDQSTEISQLLSLWDQRGSRVIRGNLLTLPLNGGILYVEPVFLQADQGQLPELSRIIVAYKDNLVMERTLEDALAAIFGLAEEKMPPVADREDDETAGSLYELVKEANRLFTAAQERSREGDWAGYGEALADLEACLSQMMERIEEEP